MKKIITLSLMALLCVAAAAQTDNKLSREHMNKLAARAEMQKQQRMRQAPKLDASKFMHDGSATLQMPATKGAKAAGDTVWASQMPEQRWFPGEWEEVQAIVVTWPYTVYPAGHVGDEDYAAEMNVPGYGAQYQYNSSNPYNPWTYIGWGPVVGVPDTTDYADQIAYYRQFLNYPQYASQAQEYIDYLQGQWDFRNVFVNLIDAIQHGTKVWITVQQLSDSTLIKDVMAAEGKPLTDYRFIENYTNAFWYRDCGPICFYYGPQDSVAMLNFEYSGRACDDLLPDSISSQTGIPNFTTSIEWEGGNCMVDGVGNLFTSDATYDENADTVGQTYYTGNVNNPVAYRYKAPLSSAQVLDSMNRMMGNTRVLPRFRYDGGTGHVDLYADMLDENRFVFSKFPSQYSAWYDYTVAVRNIDSLTSWQSFAGVNYTNAYIPFPRKDDGSYFSSQNEYNGTQSTQGYTRSYSNHTFINDIIVQPCFSEVVNGEPTASWDRANMDSLRAAYPGYTFYPIDIRSFDGYGGAIHCITKQIPAESPIRILHSPITGPQGDTYNSQDATLSARITNNTGIAQAQVVYRVDGGEWQTVAMTAGADSMYSTALPTTTFGSEGVNVEYYISATSNGGKTITKPFTAAHGAYFCFGTNGQLSIADANSTEERFGQFFPNPATEKASMVIDMQGGKNYSVNIYDLSGREVHASRLQAEGTIVYSVNADRMASGQYTVVFSNGSERVVRKLIVK